MVSVLSPSRDVRAPATRAPHRLELVERGEVSRAAGVPPGREHASPADRVTPQADRLDASPPPVPSQQAPATLEMAPITRPVHAILRPQTQTLTLPVERLDSSYLETFSYAEEGATFPAALSVLQLQRAFNRLLPVILREAPDLVAQYMPDACVDGECTLLPLKVDGLKGEYTNAARQLLVAFAGDEP
ncbi:MAG: hypothetical protein AAF658_10855, partial [Myxococcota bacterium]